MIKELTIGNFRSYQGKVTLSLEAEPLRSGKVKVIKTEAGPLLPVAGIFGPNASGKSNVIKALSYMQWAVKNIDVLNHPTTHHRHLQPFLLSKSSLKKPAFFEVLLYDEQQEAEYRYGFEINDQHVVSEWLDVTARDNKLRRSRSIFKRDGQDFSISRPLSKDLRPRMTQVTPQGLAIATFAQLNYDLARRVVSLLSEPALTIYNGAASDMNLERALSRCRDDEAFKKKVTTLIHQADLGIDELMMEELETPKDALKQLHPALRRLLKESGQNVDTVFMVYGTHRMNGDPKAKPVYFNLQSDESLGTQKFVVLASLIVEALEKGTILVVDELGASLHPFLTRAVVEQFQNPKTNKRNAQLIFCSHETYLLTKYTEMRRDQIWLAEKDRKTQESKLHHLASYKVRNDYEVAKNLLERNLGFVPETTFPSM
ncbi:MAG TPA: ATP-binding protein [Candidatus Saccharimonadales bacterium]|nr:ATP-binding protein [Candidatus Saccharimonadales bacterium]